MDPISLLTAAGISQASLNETATLGAEVAKLEAEIGKLARARTIAQAVLEEIEAGEVATRAETASMSTAAPAPG